jgi:carbonic anhydrase
MARGTTGRSGSALVLVMGAIGGAYFAFFAPGSGGETEGATTSTTARVVVETTATTPDEPAQTTTTRPQEMPAPVGESWTEPLAACVDGAQPPSAEITELVSERPPVLYSAPLIDVMNTGSELVASVAPASDYLVLDGMDFELTHLVLVPSTVHTVDGSVGSFELRYVHAGTDGQIATIGQVLTIGDTPLQLVDDLLRERPEPGQDLEVRVGDVYGAVPETVEVGHDVVAVPGCDASVHRGLMTEPAVVSADQAAAIRSLFA